MAGIRLDCCVHVRKSLRLFPLTNSSIRSVSWQMQHASFPPNSACVLFFCARTRKGGYFTGKADTLREKGYPKGKGQAKPLHLVPSMLVYIAHGSFR